MKTFTESELMRAAQAIYLECDKEVADEVSAMLIYAAYLAKRLKAMNDHPVGEWTDEKK